jgi:hypothetical protein
MTIFNVSSPEFAPYGKVVTGLDVKPVLDALKQHTPLPEGTGYVPEEPALQNLPGIEKLAVSMFGGMPVQFGWCNGHNTRLNCLEYHRSSEFNLGTEDFILLLAKEEEVIDGKLDTAKVKAFLVPAGTLVEVYATTLHYAPCHTDAAKGFRVLVALPKGTNTEKPVTETGNAEDRLLWAANKWLLAHRDSAEAKQGAYIGLTGKNLDLAQ